MACYVTEREKKTPVDAEGRTVHEHMKTTHTTFHSGAPHLSHTCFTSTRKSTDRHGHFHGNTITRVLCGRMPVQSSPAPVHDQGLLSYTHHTPATQTTFAQLLCA